MDPSQNDQRAQLEPSGQAIHLGAKLGTLLILFSHDSERRQKLGGNLIAPALDLIFR